MVERVAGKYGVYRGIYGVRVTGKYSVLKRMLWCQRGCKGSMVFTVRSMVREKVAGKYSVFRRTV